MPSILNCFCVRRHRKSFASRKRGSQKKILSSNDCASDTISDLMTDPGQIRTPNPYLPQKYTLLKDKHQTQDAEILSRLMDNHTPRRPHVEDIFRQDAVSKPTNVLKYRQPSESIESMYGYVPKAVGAVSASTALTGAKYDDFLSDRRMHLDLNKFAKSSDFGVHPYEDMFSFDYVADSQDDVYTAPAHVQIEMEHDGKFPDDVISGSVSSVASTPLSTPDNSFSPFSINQDSFLFDDPSPSKRNITAYDQRIEHLFQCDGDILY